MRVFNRYVSGRGFTVFAIETALIVGSILLAGRIHGSLVKTSSPWQVLFVASVCALCFYYNDLYNLTIVHAKGELVVRMLRGAGAAAIALGLFTILSPMLVMDGGTALTAVGFLLLAIPAWRLAFDGVSSESQLDERVLIIGTGSVARLVAREIAQQHDFAYHVVGFVGDSADEAPADLHVLGATAGITDIVARHRVDRIVVALADGRGRLPIRELLQVKLSGVRVEEGATTYERITGKVMLDQLKPSWLVFSAGFGASRLTRFTKRAVDLGCAAVGLALGWPLMLLTAAAIKLDSPGPILYRQERTGLRGRSFTVLKFRSMDANAENGTPVWATSQDARVTRVGRFIRITRIDELPQLWNVVRGEMSFVGPRPERPFFVERLTAEIPFYAERHTVRPGITGWAQVRYRYGASVEDATEKLRYDLYYIKHLSIGFDLSIFIDTVRVILAGKGAH